MDFGLSLLVIDGYPRASPTVKCTNDRLIVYPSESSENMANFLATLSVSLGLTESKYNCTCEFVKLTFQKLALCLSKDRTTLTKDWIMSVS